MGPMAEPPLPIMEAIATTRPIAAHIIAIPSIGEVNVTFTLEDANVTLDTRALLAKMKPALGLGGKRPKISIRNTPSFEVFRC